MHYTASIEITVPNSSLLEAATIAEAVREWAAEEYQNQAYVRATFLTDVSEREIQVLFEEGN